MKLSGCSRERAGLEAVADTAHLKPNVFEVPLRGGRNARAQMISEAAIRDPETYVRLQDELMKGGRRGFGQMSKEAQELLNVTPSAARVLGTPIAGTERYARKMAELSGLGREAFVAAERVLPGGSVFSRGTKGLEKALGTLTRGTGELDPLVAGTTVAVANAARIPEGTVRSLGNQSLRQLRRDIKSKGEEGIRAMVREAEVPGQSNRINEFFADIRRIYEETSGNKLNDEYLRDPTGYMPHKLTPEFRRMLKANSKNQTVAEFMDREGFYQDDLLEGSPFLEKRRQLTPTYNKDGTTSPKTVTIAGQELTIVTGSIDELNTELQKLFPSFKGKFYDDDPIRVGEAYVDSIARDAGRMKAATDIARQANPHGTVVEGPLAEALRGRNENLQQRQPIVDVVKEGYTPGQPVPSVPVPAEMPEEIAGVRLEDYFQSKVDEPASKAQRDLLIAKGPGYQEAAAKDVKAQMKGIKADARDVRKQLLAQIEEGRNEARAPLAELDKRVTDARRRFEMLKPQAKQRQEELNLFIADQQAEIAGLQTTADALKHKWRRALDRSQRGVEKKVHGLIRKNEQLLKEAEEAAKYGPLRMQQEARLRRDMLKEPWEKARSNYNKARTRAAESIARPTDERIAWARRELLEDLPDNSPEWDTLLDDYRNAQKVAGGEGARSYKGKPTKAAQAKIEEARQEVTRLRLQLSRGGRAADRETGETIGMVQPTKVAARVADYDEAAQELRDVTNQLRRETDPITADQLRTRQGQLRRRFNQGGDLNSRKRALEVTDKLAAAEQKLDEATAAEKKLMDDAYEKMQRQPEAIVTLEDVDPRWERRNPNVQSPESGRVREPTVGYRAGDPQRKVTPVTEPPQPASFDDVWHNPRGGPIDPATGRPRGQNEYKAIQTELEAIRELEKTAKTWKGNARSVALYKGRLENLRNRLDNLQAGGFDLERDLQRPLAVTAVRDQTLDAIKRELDDKSTALEAHIATEGAAIKAAKQETIDMQQVVQKGTADRPALYAEREEALNELQAIKNAVPTGKDISQAKYAELEDVLLDLEAVARANPALRDQNLAMTESLLQDLRKRTHKAVEADIMRKDVRKLTEDAYNGKLAKVMITATNENWRTLHKGLVEEGDVLISRQLDEQLTNLYELAKQPTLFGRTFNALTNLFKTYATLSPGFHVRNALSAIFMNTSDGVGLRYQLRGVRLWNQYASKEGGEKWLRKQSLEVQRAFEATFASGAGGRFQEAGVAQALAGQRLHERFYNKAISNWATRSGQRAGSWVEGSVRLGMALDSMAAGDSVQTALQRITRIHFDYSQVSKADEVMKRIVPFWTYTSRNLPLQVTQMWSNPSAYLAYENFVQNFSEEPEPFTPEYMGQAGAFNLGINVPENDLPILGAASGLPILAQPDLPQVRLAEQLGDIQKTLSLEDPAALLAMGNPLLTAPIEFATGTDLYTGRHIDENEYEPAEGLLNLPVQILAALTNQRDSSGRIKSRFLNAYRAVNPLQDRTSRLLPQGTGGDSSDAQRQAESIARFLGVPVRTLTPQQQESEYRNQVRKILEEREQAQARAQYLAAS